MNAEPKNLVVVHARAGSRHAGWLEGAASRFAVWIVTEPGLELGPLPGGVRVFDAPAGAATWPAVHAVLSSTAEAWRRFERVLFAADDLDATADELAETFALAERHGLLIAQPSLGWRSHFTSPVTLHNPSFRLRQASRVDPAAMCLASPFLEAVLPALAHDPRGQVLGRLLPALVDEPMRQCAVIDAVQVLRTREPAADDGLDAAAATLLAEFESAVEDEYSWGGIDRDGGALSLFDPATRDAFLGRLVAGCAAAVQEPAVLGEVFLHHLMRSLQPDAAAAAGDVGAVPDDPLPALRPSPIVARAA